MRVLKTPPGTSRISGLRRELCAEEELVERGQSRVIVERFGELFQNAPSAGEVDGAAVEEQQLFRIIDVARTRGHQLVDEQIFRLRIRIRTEPYSATVLRASASRSNGSDANVISIGTADGWCTAKYTWCDRAKPIASSTRGAMP
jgi:hypothetical protein